MIRAPAVDGRRVASFVEELRRFASHYTPELDLSDPSNPGVALMRIFAQLAEAVAQRLDRVPDKNFVVFLDQLGIVPVPARPSRASVAFRMVAGFPTPVLVPAGTRATASGASGEIPFETVVDLLAIPGALAAVYGVDPARDMIFRPPPDFLKQEPRATTELTYALESFAGAGDKRLQVDHVTDLQPGAYLRIDCEDKRVVAKVDKAGIITLETPLSRDVPAGARVTPIRDFDVFDGIDLQEHVLYIGHAGLLTVKEEAEISVRVELERVGGAGLELAWESWTKDEAAPSEEEHWQELEPIVDHGASFTRSGEVRLGKRGGLEIKPRKIAEIESRWIRARLKSKLTDRSAVLPSIDSIALAVQSKATNGIPADQGFYNVTPVDVKVDASVGFFPFGTEPRQFDQFYIASKEAFSKAKAKVALTFKLDLLTLGAPAALAALRSGALEPRAYSIGLRSRLYELNAATEDWEILDNPSITLSGAPNAPQYLPVSSPSAIANATGEKLLIFVNTKDALSPNNSKVWVMARKAEGAESKWVDLDTPLSATNAKLELQFDPSAVALPSDSSRVFVVDKAGDMHSQIVSNTPSGSPNWVHHQSPGVALSSSPFAVHEPTTNTVLVYATGVDQIVYEFRDGATPPWRPLPPTLLLPFLATTRPFAQPYVELGKVEAKVFVVGVQTPSGPAELFECDTKAPSIWDALGRPGAIDLVDAPAGYIETPDAPLATEGKHIFVRGSDNRLYERVDDGFTPPWQRRSLPGDPELRGAPALIATAVPSDTRMRLDVFVASNRNSLVRSLSEVASGTTANATIGMGVLFKTTLASTKDEEYTNKIVTLTDSISTFTPTITAYDGLLQLARVDQAVPSVDTSFDCTVATVPPLSKARERSDHIFPAHNVPTDARTASAWYLRLAAAIVPVRYSRRTGLALLNAVVSNNQPYSLYALCLSGVGEVRPPEETNVVPDLSWEYWNGSGWLSLKVKADGTRDLLTNGDVVFAEMPAVQETEVVGQKNFWIRARLVGGDYGRETFRVLADRIVSEKSSLRPPKVTELRIRYASEPLPPDACVTLNNLDVVDQTAASRLSGAHFLPFEPLEEPSLSLLLGFDHGFRSGPVRLLLDAAEREVDPTKPPELAWAFRKDHAWKPLDADDGSAALTRQGILALSATDALTQESRLGRPLYWVKGSLKTDSAPESEYPRPRLRGVFLNTVEATQGETITDEIVGSSDGTATQELALQHPNILNGEDIRVQEILAVEERDALEALDTASGKKSVVDRADIGGTWVRWNETRAFFDAGPQDRRYFIDRAAGRIRFGDGVHGRIPPAGIDNIRAFLYRTGGGAVGNVEAGRITTLGTSLEGVESVLNPSAAGGGSDSADTAAMLTIGPRELSHRDRAVSPRDFEELACAATRQVARARCLATTNLKRAGAGRPDPCDALQRHEAAQAHGWVSVIIVPESAEPRPCPSLALRNTVHDYLLARAPGLLAATDRLVVRPPDYVPVSIEAFLFVASLDRAARVESAAQKLLSEFLHPLRGGAEKTGWEFGRAVSASDVFAVLEGIADVDHVENLSFRFSGQTRSDRVEIGPNELMASDVHVLHVKEA